MKWYQIKAKGGKKNAAEIMIHGDIGESIFGETVTARKLIKDLQAIESDEIKVRLNSWGGSVTDGIAIYNALRSHKAHITVDIEGVAASIASLIAMAGDTVRMGENTQMMVHAPWTVAIGNSADIRETAEELDRWARSMASSYMAKTGKSEEELMALLTDGKNHWFNSEEALDFGFVDEVTAKIKMAASINVPEKFDPPEAFMASDPPPKPQPKRQSNASPEPAGDEPVRLEPKAVIDMCNKSGFKALALDFIAMELGENEINAKLRDASRVKELCAAADLDDRDQQDLAAKFAMDPLDAFREVLQMKLSESDDYGIKSHVSPNNNPSPQAKQPDPTKIYSERNKAR